MTTEPAGQPAFDISKHTESMLAKLTDEEKQAFNHHIGFAQQLGRQFARTDIYTKIKDRLERITLLSQVRIAKIALDLADHLTEEGHKA